MHEIFEAGLEPTDTSSAPLRGGGNGGPESAHNESLIQSIVRAHGWIHCLRDGAHQSIEQLAKANGLHPKVVRQAIRLAFLSPDLTSAILEGDQPKGLSLARIPKLLPLSWAEHRPLLG
jgi:site-specific DNA recombinase